MEMDVLKIILAITVIISIAAFQNSNLLNKLMFVPYECKHHGTYSRFITHMFIHGDWMHLIFNMFALFFLGDVLLNASPDMYVGVDGGFIHEYGKALGQIHFIVLYILGGLFSTLIPYIRHHNNPGYRSLGASGAVSAIVFAAIMWNPTMPLQIMFIPVPIPAYIFGPLYLLFEFYADRRGKSGIAHDAHIGGAIFGIIYIFIINFDRAIGIFNNF